jgi:fermentation-respiration switch protein FrsA (DUF1100 family)
MQWSRHDRSVSRPMMNRRELIGAFAVTAATLATSRVAAQESPMIDESWSVGGLAGSLARPKNGPARGPAVLIIAGSGPEPRDGSYRTYIELAQGLAGEGIRSLRYDKRGIGGSRGLVTREDDLTVQTFADDAITAARDLAARPDVSAVVIAGHSEGSLLATLAAAKTAPAGIVHLAGPGRKLDVILREQIIAIPLPPAQEHYRQEAIEILDKLVRGERVPNVPPEQAVLFRTSVQAFLISMFAVDPAAGFGKLTQPALVVQGASDIQVRMADFELLTTARPDARKLLLPATNHVFKRAPVDLTDRAGQQKSYDRNAPLVPELVPAVAEFVKSVAK